jgi:type IV pilus assembly protein PilA
MYSSVIERLSARRDAAVDAGEDAGFTLIELMVVLLIMAILLAIAIPTFLGVSGSANDRAAQSNLNTALTNVKSYYQNNNQTFGTSAAATIATAMTTQEPSLKWTSGASTASAQISVYGASDGNAIVLASESKTGYCWYMIDTEATTADTSIAAVDPATPVAGNVVAVNSGVWYGVSKAASCIASSVPVQSTASPLAPIATASVFNSTTQGFPNS